jgi:hypothetical protein
MAGLVPAIHVFSDDCHKDVEARDKPGMTALKQAPLQPTEPFTTRPVIARTLE